MLNALFGAARRRERMTVGPVLALEVQSAAPAHARTHTHKMQYVTDSEKEDTTGDLNNTVKEDTSHRGLPLRANT